MLDGLPVAVVAALIWSALASEPVPRLASHVQARVAESGVTSEVTAVLLNFRSYDTLVEIGVLLLAVVAARSLHAADHRSAIATAPLGAGPEVSPLLRWFVERLAPVGLLVAGYLWWAGSTKPGGAFQGGTVLAAALVLLLLAGRIAQSDTGRFMYRLWICGGLLLFLLVALVPPLRGMPLLAYPPGWSGSLILLIEAGLTFSIAASLLTLVIGVPASVPLRSRES